MNSATFSEKSARDCVKDTKIREGKQEFSSDLFSKIQDSESKFYREMGLSLKEITLLKRLVLFSKKNAVFSAKDAYLMEVLGVCRKTVSNCFGKLKKLGFISVKISRWRFEKRFISSREISMLPEAPLWENFSRKKTSLKTMEKEEAGVSLPRKIHPLAKIVKTVAEEKGIDISLEKASLEAENINSRLDVVGRERITRKKDGKILIFSYVRNWVENDKFGYFFKERERQGERERERERELRERRERELRETEEERQRNYQEITDEANQITSDLFRKFGKFNEKEEKILLERILEKFENHEYLKEFLEDNELSEESRKKEKK